MINPLVLNPTARELVDTVNEVISEVNAGGTPAPVPATHPLNATETEIGIGLKLTASEADQKGSYVTTDPVSLVLKSMSVSGFSTGAYSDIILMTGKKVFEVIPVCPAIAGTGGNIGIYLSFVYWDVSYESPLFDIPIISLASGGFTICGVSVPSIPSRLRVVIDSTNMPTSAEYSVYDGATLIFTDTIGHPPESGEIAMKFIIQEEPAVGGPGGGGGLTFSIQTITDSSLFLTPLGVGETDIDGNEGAPVSGIPEAPIDGQQYARKDGGWEVVVGGGGTVISTDTNLLVPSQYATVQAAVDAALGFTVQNGAKVTIVIDSSHTITSQVVVKNGDYKWLHITTTGGTVSVDSTTFVNNTPFGEAPLFYFENTMCQVSGNYSLSGGPTTIAIFSYISTVAVGTGFVSSTFTNFGKGNNGAITSFFSDVGLGNVHLLALKAPALYLSASKCRWDTGSAVLDVGTDKSLFTVVRSEFLGNLTSLNAQAANNSAVYCIGSQNSKVNLTVSSITMGNATLINSINSSDVYLAVTNLNMNYTGGANSGIECYNGSKAYLNVVNSSGTPSTAFIGEVFNGGVITAVGQSSSAYTGGYNQAVNIPTSNGLILAPQLEAWTSPTLLNSWANIAGWQAAQYRKVGDMVQIRFSIENGTDFVLFNLPVGFRPPVNISFTCNVHDSANAPEFGHLIVESNGDVIFEHHGTLSNHKVYAAIEFSVLS